MCDQQQWDASSHEELLFACFLQSSILLLLPLLIFLLSFSLAWFEPRVCFLCSLFPLSVLFCLYTIYSNLHIYYRFARLSLAFARSLWLAKKKKINVSHWEPISPPRHHSRGFACWLLAKGTLLYNCLWRCSCRTRIVRASEPITSVRICLANHIWFLFFYFFSCVLCGLNFVRVANGSPMLGGCGGEFY